MTDEQYIEILQQRAKVLAHESGDGKLAEDGFEVALIAVGNESFGIPVEGVREIVALPEVTPLPHLPPHFRGLSQVRGELLAVIDVGIWLDVESRADPAYLVLLEGEQGPVGLTAEKVLGFRRIYSGEISAAQAEAERPVSAITSDLTAIIDLQRLLSSEALIVS